MACNRFEGPRKVLWPFGQRRRQDGVAHEKARVFAIGMVVGFENPATAFGDELGHGGDDAHAVGAIDGEREVTV
jgi:hypothetical protein